MLTPEQIAEIERPVPMGSEALWKLNEQKDQLLAEVKRLREELGQLRLDDEAEQRATALSPSDFDEPF